MYDSYVSSSWSPRSVRKTQVRSRKRTKKNRLAARKKKSCSGQKLFVQRGKTSAKNAASQREKCKAARKNTLQQQKSRFAAEEMHSGGSGKNRPRREKPVRGKTKNRPRQEKNLQQRSPALQPKTRFRDANFVGRRRQRSCRHDLQSVVCSGILLNCLQETRTSTKEGTET